MSRTRRRVASSLRGSMPASERSATVTCVAAFDVGGTRMKSGLVVDGRVEPLPLAAHGLDWTDLRLSDLLVGTVRDVVAAGGVDAVGYRDPRHRRRRSRRRVCREVPGLVGLDVAGDVADVAQVPVRLANTLLRRHRGRRR